MSESITAAVAQVLDALDDSDIDAPLKAALLDVTRALQTSDTATVAQALDRALAEASRHPFIDPAALLPAE